jgi:hypothetical protein
LTSFARKSPSTNKACISRLLTAKETSPHLKNRAAEKRARQRNGNADETAKTLKNPKRAKRS